MILRPYEVQDHQEVLDLHQSALKAIGAFRVSPSLDQDLNDIHAAYLCSGGQFLVGEIANRIIAMGALKRIDNETGEIKRMRVRIEYQGNGIGQQLLTALEKFAMSQGITKLVLDTSTIQVAACGLYLKNGYVQVAQKEIPDMTQLFFEKILPGARDSE